MWSFRRGGWTPLRERILNLQCASNSTSLSEDAQAFQSALDRLMTEASRYGMWFAPSKCEVLLQDWQGPVPVFTICGERSEVVNSHKFLWNLIEPGREILKEFTLGITKPKAAIRDVQHFWRRHDIQLSFKESMQNATVHKVLLFGCDAWSHRIYDTRRLSAFTNGYLQSIACVWWRHGLSNDEVHRPSLGAGSRFLTDLIAQRHFQWLGHSVFACPLSTIAFFEHVRQGPGGMTLQSDFGSAYWYG